MNDQANSIWQMPATAPDTAGNRPGRTAADAEQWRVLVQKVIAHAAAGNWTKADAARRIGMAEGSFHQWFSGTYGGRYDTMNQKVSQWLDGVDEMNALAGGIPESPGFVMTRTARELIENLVYAQMMPDMTVVNLGAGMGKTMTCRHFAAIRPHVAMVTMRPKTQAVHAMLVEIAATLGVNQQNPAKLDRAIGERLRRNGRKTLLIVDEAQNLGDTSIDQLRYFLDEYQCGLALVGNEELYGRLSAKRDGPSYAQIKRRIGKRLKRLTPYAEDIELLLDAWGITDPASRTFLSGIGRKAGALGQIDKTLKLAGMLAAGDGVPIAEKHIRAAWQNRSVEDLG